MKKISIGTFSLFGFIKRTVSISPNSLSHMHILGKTNSGKSRFIARLFLSLYDAGIATTLVDPHGDLARLILAHLVNRGHYKRESAFEKVLYLDLPAAERQSLYLPFNILKSHLPTHTIASNFKEAMHRAFPELAFNAPTFDTLLPRAVRVLITNNVPLTQLERFFIDTPFRNGLLEIFDDPNIVYFFQEAYEEMRKADQLTYAGSVLRRAALLTDLPVLKNSLGQDKNELNFRRIMDEGRFTIINLALREQEAARLFGSLIMVGMEQSALERANPDRPRTPHYIIIDEFAQFVAQSGEAVEAMLSQTRKYHLWLCMAHQTWSQATERLQGALQNVDFEVAYAQGRMDAEYTAKLMGSPDLLHVKNEPETGANPLFYPLMEEWEAWTQAIQNLLPRQFYFKRQNYHKPFWKRILLDHKPAVAAKLKSLPMPDVQVNNGLLEQIEDEYISRYFRKPPEIQVAPIPIISPPKRKISRKRKLA